MDFKADKTGRLYILNGKYYITFTIHNTKTDAALPSTRRKYGDVRRAIIKNYKTALQYKKMLLEVDDELYS